MTAPSVEEVMRSVSRRAPSIRWVGASDEMIQLSTTEPMLEPMKPPMVAALTPRIAPPMLPPMAAPAAPRTRVAMFGCSALREQEGEGELARPRRGERFLDHAEPLIGVEEGVGSGQDSDMLGDGAGLHAEEDQRARTRLGGRHLDHHGARALGQQLARTRLAPVAAVRRDRERLWPDEFPPDAPRESEAVATHTAQAGLIMI